MSVVKIEDSCMFVEVLADDWNDIMDFVDVWVKYGGLNAICTFIIKRSHFKIFD